MYINKEKSKLLIEETIDVLRNKDVKSTQYERIWLIDKLNNRYKDMPHALRQGYYSTYILENVSCPVEEYDILLGRVVDRKLTDEEEEKLKQISENGYNEKAGFMWDWGHMTFDWENIVKIGISGYIKKAQERLERAIAEGADAASLNFLQGMILVYKAYRRYILRYAEAANKKGLTEAAKICLKIADNPPETFVEAIQFVLFVTHIYSVYSASGNATLSMGRIDDYLYPFYERDIASGAITREEAGYVIDDFNSKCAMILGRGEHQMSGGTEHDTGWFRNPMYDSPTYAIIGGLSNHRPGDGNDLTKLFLERIQPRFENPVYVLRRTNNIPDDVWEIACDKLRTNSTLLVYNDETVIPALERAGMKHEDAINYTLHGCNWIDFQGKGKGEMSNDGIIPRYLMNVLWDDNGDPINDYSSIDEVYDALGDAWRADIKGVYENYRNRFVRNPAPLPGGLFVWDCFMDGTIDNMNNMTNIAEYPSVYLQVRNIGTAADIMSGLENVVFKKKAVSFVELGKILKADFVGYEDIYKLCKNSPKYGEDNDIADGHANRIMTLLTDINYEESFNKETGKQDVFSTNVTITDMWYRGEGERLGASPDGRHKGEPLSENLSPTCGSSESVTALLNSVTKLPMDRICSGALNVRMPKNLVTGDDGLQRVKILLATYFENGGMQVQLSVADTAELRDAQKNPENYKDLMVRITGYSSVFVDMCTSAQNEIIRRDEVC